MLVECRPASLPDPTTGASMAGPPPRRRPLLAGAWLLLAAILVSPPAYAQNTIENVTNQKIAQKFAATTTTLKATAQSRDLIVNWDRFDAYLAKAESQRQAGDFAAGVRGCCEAISFLLAEMRSPKNQASLSGPSADNESVL